VTSVRAETLAPAELLARLEAKGHRHMTLALICEWLAYWETKDICDQHLGR